MLTLYPPIQPYAVHQLAVEEPHVLHVEESGNPNGLPVLFLHGGPGFGCCADHRRFFDPESYRIILFDQRGAGLSTPHASLENNTTQALVQDMETIRIHLGVEQWVLFGGSWGSTLALVYAQTHPTRVLNMILRGIFLCRYEDIYWFYQQGASRLFPDHFEAFLEPLNEEERKDTVSSYYKRLTGEDEIARMTAAKAWSIWEGSCATLDPNPQVVNNYTTAAMSVARIETHFFINNTFLEPNQILENAHLLAGIPGTIVHGRYDVVCPLENATSLHKVWPEAELQIIRDAGHSATELGIINALVAATNRVARLVPS
jgi:proline iminopeptidase